MYLSIGKMGEKRNPVSGLSDKSLDLAPHYDYTIKIGD
jgi:hypothetical protein